MTTQEKIQGLAKIYHESMKQGLFGKAKIAALEIEQNTAGEQRQKWDALARFANGQSAFALAEHVGSYSETNLIRGVGILQMQDYLTHIGAIR